MREQVPVLEDVDLIDAGLAGGRRWPAEGDFLDQVESDGLHGHGVGIDIKE